MPQIPVQVVARDGRGLRAHFTVFRQRLASGLSWNLLSALSLQGSVLIASVVVARILGLSSFGAYSLLVTTVMTIAAIAQGGSGLVAAKFVGENLAVATPSVARVLRMCRNFTLASGVLAALLMMVAAETLCREFLKRPDLASSVRLTGLAAFFQVSVSYQFGALQGFGAFRQLSRVGVITGITHVAFNAAGAWFGGLEGALLGFTVASAFRFAAFAVLLRGVCREHEIPPCDRLRGSEWRMVLHFALPAGLSGLVTMSCLWLVTVLVAKLPEGLAAVALLSAAHQLRMAVLQLPSLLNAVSFSQLSRLKGQRETASYREVFWSGLWMSVLFATVVVITLSICADRLLLIYGPDFTAGRWVLILLLISVVPEVLTITTYQLIQSAGRMWHSLFLIAAPRDFAYLLLASALVQTHGTLGAAIAYLTAQAIALGSTVVIARSHAHEMRSQATH